MLVLKKLHFFIYLFVRYLRHLRYINEQNKQKSFPSLILHTSGRKQTINKEQSKLTKEKHCKKKSCVKRIGNTKWSWQTLRRLYWIKTWRRWVSLDTSSRYWKGKAFQAMRLGSAKALRQKHAWYDQKKSQEVTEAGMEKAVRRVVGNEVREVAGWC